MIGNLATLQRPPQLALEAALTYADEIRPLVRMHSATLTAACRQCGLPYELAELCGGLLASVIEDLVNIGNLPRTDFERTKRKQRVLAAAQEPAASALRVAMVASPVNGMAAAAHWDVVCESEERGKLAWLLGVDSEAAYSYGARQRKHEGRRR